ncbi:arabinose transporter [Erwinia billingiae]|uniref:arabinose transporter n=1 Tax=Erwinia billingiae TaxID=182337 RepID=UPI0022450146|nr:arabinose transporter [Erwinia billingiae]MCX0498272.1 MFS transporter [Erwinia billingiae]
MQSESVESNESTSFMRMLLTLMLVVLAGFLIIGIALPVLPRYVHHQLGFGTFAVGLVTGAQFAASLATRFAAGRYADQFGGRKSIHLGLLLAVAGGIFYLISLPFASQPIAAIVLVLIGRAIVGGAESFIITGGMTLGLALAGGKQTGRVIAWVGTAMFAAFALGAPLGTAIFDHFGFAAIAITTALLPIAAMIVVRILPERVEPAEQKGTLSKALSSVWLPGLGAAFNGVGYAALLSFSVLMYAERGWGMGWLPVSAFAAALIAARLFLGQLIDRSGGIRVGISFSLVTALGQILLWAAPSPWIAAAGAALAGAGWAMVYPAFGSEAVRRLGGANKGVAMATYSAFPDLAIGLASPLLGLVVTTGHMSMVFLWSSIVVMMAIPIALLARKKQ